MEKLIAGIIIGLIIAAETFMVIFCVWYERRFPNEVPWHHCESDSTTL